MKLTTGSIDFLKNYSQINTSIYIKAGSVIRTISPGKNIFAHVEVSDSFPSDFAIYDLPRFLGVVSLFNSPDFDFGSTDVKISSGNVTMRYVYADESHVLKAPDKDPNPEEQMVEVTLTKENLNSILKASGIMKHGDLSITGTVDGAINLVVHDKEVASSDEYKIEVGPFSGSDDFSYAFKIENLRSLLPADYTFSVHRLKSNKFVGNFKSKTDGEAPNYWIASESVKA